MIWRRRVLVSVCAMVLASCTDAPGLIESDAGRRARVDGGPAPDAFTERPSEPVLPAVDFEVTLPFGESASFEIQVGSSVADLDLVLSVDTTGSFDGEIDALQREFVGTIIPSLEERVTGLAIAVSHFEDFPADGLGADDDVPFELLMPITTDSTRVSAAIARLDMPLGAGGDTSESGYEALYQIATGDGLEWNGAQLVAPWDADRAGPGGGREPGVGLRTESLRAVIHVTDAPSHDGSEYGPGAHTLTQAVSALNAARLRVIGIASGTDARDQLEELALRTGATLPAEGGSCATGLGGAPRASIGDRCPLVFDIASDGTGLSDAIVQAVADLLRSLSYDAVYGRASEDRFAMVAYVEAARADFDSTASEPTRTDERPVDGHLDTFREVDRGVTMTFAVHLTNDSIRPGDYDQRFTFAIEIVGDDAVIATRTVRVTVPRGRIDRPDAGSDAGELDTGDVDASSGADASSVGAIDDAAIDDAAIDDAAIDDAGPTG